MSRKDEELVRVYTTTDLSEAELLQNALKDEGVRSMLENPHQAGLSGVLQIGILVREEDADRARKIVKQREPKRSE